MKNSILLFPAFLLVFLASSCGTIEEVSWFNLPRVGTSDGNLTQRGALIVDPKGMVFNNLKGELLYVTDSADLVLENKLGGVDTLKYGTYQEFNLHMYRPQATTLGWALPTMPLLVFAHGTLVLVSWPTTLLTSGMNLYSERHAYKVSLRTMTRDQLLAYARFPVGVPKSYFSRN